VQKAILGSRVASIWLLNADKFTEVDFEATPQTNEVVLQTLEKEKRSAEVVPTSGSETLLELSHDESQSQDPKLSHQMNGNQGHEGLLFPLIFCVLQNHNIRKIMRRINLILESNTEIVTGNPTKKKLRDSEIRKEFEKKRGEVLKKEKRI
jgi:hypothetical protein